MDYPANQHIEPLSEREFEILNGLDEGLSNAQIAERLFLAPSTVKWYVRQLNSKFCTENREQIVQRALKLGLLSDDAPQPAPSKHNLPYQTTPFVGRDAELDEVYHLLTDPNVRLLTVLAPGGMGKTRLALEAAEQQLDHFHDGVYFVPLQPLSDPEHIVPQIATNTGYQFHSDEREPKQQVLDYLGNKQMLLLLDNFEHLLDGAALVSDILQAAPDVKLLVTSREKLNLSVESVYVLRGMQFPTWETPEVAMRYDAVKLLVLTARRVKPGWKVSEDNLDDAARVCRLTEGMPLGILLAASWLDVYDLQRICDEIQQSADFLDTEMRDVPERQRSIRAVFEAAWRRLKPDEQQVFMKMSVFRGGCSPRAAEAITGANPRTLQSLVNTALLLHNRQGRYDIHELLRQYAETELEQSGEADAIRDAHMTYYADAMHARENDLKGGRQIEALNEIETDLANVEAVLS